MTLLSSYQHEVLAAIGIGQWQLRLHASPDESQQQQPLRLQPAFDGASEHQTLVQDLQALFESAADAATLTWQLGDGLSLQNNILTTPPLTELVAQPKLKAQLWQLLQPLLTAASSD